MGVYVDNKLSFKNHIDYITSKISRNTGIFYKIRNNLPMKARLNFYYSFIYPFLIYNVINYGSTYSSHLVNLICQHKRIIRAIANAGYYDHTSPLFSRLKLLKFSDIYRYNVAVYMYQHCSNFQIQHDVNTRSRSMAATVPSFNRLTICQHSITFMGPKVWNNLPLYVRNSSSISKFKKNLKVYFIDQY